VTPRHNRTQLSPWNQQLASPTPRKPKRPAVVDQGGYLVHLRRLDGTQLGSVAVAEEKAKSAALFRRPTKAFADALASGRTAVLRLPGAIPIEGGVPLLVGDQVVGAIGVSGVMAEQDGQIAEAGAKAFSKP
jgi:glc operon protein GlcG